MEQAEQHHTATNSYGDQFSAWYSFHFDFSGSGSFTNSSAAPSMSSL
jgi:hypothetical protein